MQYNRPAYRVFWFPFLPAFSLLFNAVLMASLPAISYIQFAIFLAVVLVMYFM